MARVATLLGSGQQFWVRARRRLLQSLLLGKFARVGARVWFDPDGIYSFSSIEVGDDSFLGLKPVLLATRSRIRIGRGVMFGPEVHLIAGNHRIDLVGVPMVSVKDSMKRPCDDKDISVEDDVWLGARVTVLQGVTIGRGSVVGAGSVVTRSIPPYSIAVGSPARIVRRRFEGADIATHDAALSRAWDV